MHELILSMAGLTNELLANNFLLASSTDVLMEKAKNIVGPILLFCIAVAAIPYIWNKQITQIIMFTMTAVLVIFLFYGTDFLKSITEKGSKDLGNTKTGW